jgi:hypothetical protein
LVDGPGGGPAGSIVSVPPHAATRIIAAHRIAPRSIE